MANLINSHDDFGDINEYDISWDTGLTVGSVFAIDSTDYRFDFSRYDVIHITPVTNTGTIATSAYVFGFATRGDDNSRTPCRILEATGLCAHAEIGTGAPAASLRETGYLIMPVRNLYVYIFSAGTGLTGVNLKVTGYKTRR